MEDAACCLAISAILEYNNIFKKLRFQQDVEETHQTAHFFTVDSTQHARHQVVVVVLFVVFCRVCVCVSVFVKLDADSRFKHAEAC